MDIQSLLDNQNVKNILNKIGVNEEQQKSVIKQASEFLSSKILNDPSSLASFFSSNPNSDNASQSSLQGDFFKDLVEKVGLPADIADKVSGSLPDMLKGFDMNSLTGVLDAFTGNSKGGKSKNSKGGGLSGVFGMLTSLFGKK